MRLIRNVVSPSLVAADTSTAIADSPVLNNVLCRSVVNDLREVTALRRASGIVRRNPVPVVGKRAASCELLCRGNARRRVLRRTAVDPIPNISKREQDIVVRIIDHS